MTMTMTLREIQALAAQHAADRLARAQAMAHLSREMQAIYDRHRHAINAALDRAAASEQALRRAIAAHPECFVKPKTHTIDAVKYGLRSSKGRLVDPESDNALAEAIHEHLPELEPDLVKIAPQVERKMLRDLSEEELAAIGCAVVDSGDQVVITYPQSDDAKLAEAAVKSLRAREEAEL